MPVVTFAPEPSIHNLQDAPSPQPDRLTLSLVADSPMSPPRESSLHHSSLTSLPPLPPISGETDSQGDGRDQLVVPSLENDIKDLGSVDEEDRSSTVDEEQEGNNGEGEVYGEEGDTKPPLKICGIKLPACFQKRPKWNRVSARVVSYAPCFWCMPRNRSGTGITDWAIVYRLNILCMFFAAGQIASAIWLLIVLYAPRLADRSQLAGRQETSQFTPNTWNINVTIYILGAVGLVLFILELVTLRVVRQVNMAGLLRYLWVMVWLIPLEIVLIVGLFDYHRVSVVWVKHWWYVPAMAYFRQQICDSGTERTLCTVPLCGLPTFGIDAAIAPYEGTDTVECRDGEREWCTFHYNATECTSIRDGAQSTVERNLLFYYYLNVIWGVLLILTLVLTVQMLESLITKPIVQKSRESNVPGWLTFPIVCSASVGIILLFSQSSVLNSEVASDYHLLGIGFLVTSALFFSAALWGWFLASFTIMNSRDKQTKRVVAVLFIITLVITLVLVAIIFCVSIVNSVDIVDVEIPDEDRGIVACSVDTADSCSFCNGRFGDGLVECPEWTYEDVSKVVQTQLKQAATWAAIFMVYAVSALRFGIILRKHINQYEIDYV